MSAALSSAESSPVGWSPRGSVSDDSWASPTFITITSSTIDQQQLHRPTTSNSRRLQLPTTLDSLSVVSTDELSTATSSDTLVPGSPGHLPLNSTELPSTAPTLTATTATQSSSGLKRSLAALLLGADTGRKSRADSTSSLSSHQLNALALSPATSPKFTQSPLSALRRFTSPPTSCDVTLSGPAAATRRATSPSPLHRSPVCSPKLPRASSPISYSYSSPNIINNNLAKSRAACMSVSLSIALNSTWSSVLTVASHSFESGAINPLKGSGVNWLHFAIQV